MILKGTKGDASLRPVNTYETNSHGRFHCFLSTVNIFVEDFFSHVAYDANDTKMLLSILAATVMLLPFIIVYSCVNMSSSSCMTTFSYAMTTYLKDTQGLKEAPVWFMLSLIILKLRLDPEISRKVYWHFLFPLWLERFLDAGSMNNSSNGLFRVWIALMVKLLIFCSCSAAKAFYTRQRWWAILPCAWCLRLEDEPFSLALLGVQVTGYYVIYGFIGNLLRIPLGSPAVVLIPDGFAALVGKFVGKNIYTVPDVLALCNWSGRKRWMQRSFEGSLAFFASCYVMLDVHYDNPWHLKLFCAALLTLTEAASPHSLDNAIMGGVLAVVHNQLLNVRA